MAVPCNMRESSIIPGSVDNIRDDCILDQSATFGYLDSFSFLSLYNEEKFSPEGKQKVSMMKNLRVNNEQPE